MTTGTKIAATRSARRWTGALPDCARVTRAPICASAVSAPTRVARTTIRPPTFTVAPVTASPGPTSTGTLSPVSSERSTAEEPSTTSPSVAIFSPGRTTKTSPVRSRSTGTRRSPPSSPSTAASFAPSAMSARRASPARRFARASKVRPASRNVMTTPTISKYTSPAGPPRSGTRLSSWRIPGSPAPRKNSETTDHVHAAIVPIEMSVSIVAVPWRRFVQAARWKGYPHHSSTGVASCSDSHCQLSNCSAGIIPSTSSGSDSAAETIRRTRRRVPGRRATGGMPCSRGGSVAV